LFFDLQVNEPRVYFIVPRDSRGCHDGHLRARVPGRCG
jgi:hypothetical protein